MIYRRAFVIVLDSLGIGASPDAHLFGDEGAHTLRAITRSPHFYTPNLYELGLFNIDETDCRPPHPHPYASYGKMTEQSAGKDTTLGHWEIAGLIQSTPFPTYPNGFPEELLSEFSRRTGRKVICNIPISGTEAIRLHGEEHLKTGALIVYTSADSVFQIAAHEDIIPTEQLYEYCQIARELLVDKHAVARVIARPFTGTAGSFTRTANRRDFSVTPPKSTILDYISGSGQECIAIGKISDIFAGKGITNAIHTHNNIEGMQAAIRQTNYDYKGLVFVNLVDFDMLYGHRNDIDGYARALSEFDSLLTPFISSMTARDVLMITADHGCDPAFPGTDHTREHTPMIIFGDLIKRNVNLGIRSTFADIGATVLDYLNVSGQTDGDSFLDKVIL